MAFYLLLAIPHIAALGGLFIWAARVEPCSPSDEHFGGSEGGDGGSGTPLGPNPVQPSGGLPLDGSEPPARRLRVGERLADLHPPVPRRDPEHAPVPPRVPARN